MAKGIVSWSQTAASNASADSTVNFAEGQAPSSVNDSARALMAYAAMYRVDRTGPIGTGGTSTAYTVTSYQGFGSLSALNGQMIAFSPHTTNGATVTLNVDSLGAKPLRSAPSTELLAGTLVQGTPYLALYNSSDSAFYLHGFYNNPYNVPLMGGMDFWDTIAPNSAFIFPAGQAISRTTYASVFARWGTTYGVGDGSTTFNVPDKTGRISAMKEASATRLTSTYFGGNSTTLGAVGGGESSTLLTANLPPYTPAGTNSTSITQIVGNTSSYAAGANTGIQSLSSGAGTNLTTAAQTFTGTAQGGTSTPVRTVPPTIVCNYIIRVL